MKKLVIFVLIIVTLVATSISCKKIIRNIFQGIDADVPEFSVTIPPIPIVLPIAIPIPISQHFNLDSTVKANTGGVFGANDVTSVKVKQVVFNLSDADSLNNLSNFESVRVTFSSDVKTDTVTVASVVFPETYAATVTYTPVNSPELKPYLTGSVLHYTIFGKIRRVTTKSLHLSIKVTLRVR